MENFINTQLQPVETCAICTEAFGADHQPVTLHCKHIFGHECIQRWLRTGQGNNHATCPNCRYVLYERPSPHSTFNVPSIWKALGKQPPERLHTFMTKIWSSLQNLWQNKPSGSFTVTELLHQAIIPALMQTMSPNGSRQTRDTDPFLDCYNLITATWDSLGRPDSATGLAIPLVRLARLMSSASTSLPKWLTTVPRINRLFWQANASIELTDPNISWDLIIEASEGRKKTQNFALLHLYTMLISQSMVHGQEPILSSMRRHEIMNAVVERYYKKIGRGVWRGRPSDEFMEVLVVVYEELRRYQIAMKKPSLRGHDGEEDVVRGLWALARWGVKKV